MTPVMNMLGCGEQETTQTARRHESLAFALSRI
jgi:hypothetical protein